MCHVICKFEISPLFLRIFPCKLYLVYIYKFNLYIIILTFKLFMLIISINENH